MAALRSVNRSILLPADPARAWEALRDPGALGRWLGMPVSVDVSPGSVGLAGDRIVQIERVEPQRVLSFSWWPLHPGPDPASRVKIVMERVEEGTQITVTETVLADLPSALDTDGVMEASAR